MARNSLYVVVGFAENESKPKALYVGNDGVKARLVLKTAGDKDASLHKAHLFVNAPYTGRTVYVNNLPKPEPEPEDPGKKAENEGAPPL